MTYKMEKTSSGYWKKWSVVKPCPFCGGRAEIDRFEEAETYEPNYYYQGERLRCLGCGIMVTARKNDFVTEETPYYDVEYSKEIMTQMRKTLIKKWNKRV